MTHAAFAPAPAARARGGAGSAVSPVDGSITPVVVGGGVGAGGAADAARGRPHGQGEGEVGVKLGGRKGGTGKWDGRVGWVKDVDYARCTHFPCEKPFSLFSTVPVLHWILPSTLLRSLS